MGMDDRIFLVIFVLAAIIFLFSLVVIAFLFGNNELRMTISSMLFLIFALVMALLTRMRMLEKRVERLEKKREK